MSYNFSFIYEKIKNNQKIELKSHANPDINDFNIIYFLQDIQIKDIKEDNFQIVFDEILKQNDNEFIVKGGCSFNLLSLCCAYRPDFPEYVFDYLGSKMNLKNNEKHTNYLLKKAIDNKDDVNIEKESFENSFLLYEKFKLTPLKSRKSKIFNYYFDNNIKSAKRDLTSVFLRLINFNFENDVELFKPYSHTKRNIESFNYFLKDYILKESSSNFSNPKLRAIEYTDKMFHFLTKEIDYNILFDYHNALLNEYSSHIAKAPLDIVLDYFLSIDDYHFQKNKVIPMVDFFHSICEKRFPYLENPVKKFYLNSYLSRIRLEEKIKIQDSITTSNTQNEDKNKIYKKRI